MFNVRDTLAFLYPDASYQAIEMIVFRIESGSIVSFDEQDLLRLNTKEYAKPEVQERLIQVLVEVANGGEVGRCTTVLDQLEINSAGTIDFEELGAQNRRFYLRYYAAAGALAFEYIGDLRQKFLFGTFFLPLMMSYESQLYTLHVKKYFEKFYTLSLLQEARDNLVYAMEHNEAPIGVGLEKKKIREWVSDYRATDPKGVRSVSTYLEREQQFGGMDAFAKAILHQIIFIYHKLITGEIWREGDETGKEKFKFDLEAFYLKRLKDAPTISTWLESYEEALPWLEKRKEQFIKNLFDILKQKINIDKDQEQMMNLLSFVSRLPPAWKKQYENMIFFDERDGAFHWNTALLK